MKTIEFLTVLNDNKIQEDEQALGDMLKPLQADHSISVHAITAQWDDLWKEVSSIGIHGRGVDASEIGTTWLESFRSMNALRAFHPKEITSLGGSAAFMPACWNMTTDAEGQVWGIPLRADARVLYFWSDMVQAAGVDPHTDFQSPQRFAAAMEKLRSILPTPLCLPTRRQDYNTLNDATAWIWGSGGDFVDSGGKRMSLLDPPSRSGLEAYLSLGRYMKIAPNGNSDVMVVEQFVRRETAVIYGGPYVWPTLVPLGKEKLALVGNALPPGPAFIGGTLFVVWNHSRMADEAVELVRHLTSPRVQPDYTGLISLLPVCRETWELPPYSIEPRYRVFREALLQGRSLSMISLWGIIENRLTHTLSDAWMDGLRNPGKSASDLVDEFFVPLVERLNLTLSSLPAK